MTHRSADRADNCLPKRVEYSASPDCAWRLRLAFGHSFVAEPAPRGGEGEGVIVRFHLGFQPFRCQKRFLFVDDEPGVLYEIKGSASGANQSMSIAMLIQEPGIRGDAATQCTFHTLPTPGTLWRRS